MTKMRQSNTLEGEKLPINDTDPNITGLNAKWRDVSLHEPKIIIVAFALQ